MKGWRAAGLVALGALIALVGVRLWPVPAVPAEAPAGAGAAPTEAQTGDGLVGMTVATQRRLGVTTLRLQAGTAPVLETGFARALDLSPLAAIETEIAVARAAEVASAADARRLQLLAAQDQSASTRAVQAAGAVAAADHARTAQARSRVALEFGPGLAQLGDGARARLLADAAAGRAALLRIDIPGIAPAAGARVQIGTGAAATVIGAASAADARLQSPGGLAILRGNGVRDAAVGRLLPATLATSASAAGVILPRDGVLRWHGSMWAYRLVAPERFERVELADARAVASGWFTATGVAAGDRIVATGAGMLLAAERGAAAGGEDE